MTEQTVAMRYEAQEIEPGEWDVGDSDGKYVANLGDRYWTEAEAKIIAWALNAVAEGMTLGAWHDPDFGPMYGWYEGPTEGVAPHA